MRTGNPKCEKRAAATERELLALVPTLSFASVQPHKSPTGTRYNFYRVIVLLLLLLPAFGLAQPTRSGKQNDYSKFSIITERNIFNPRRLARNKPGPTQPASRVDALTLVGTMTYEKGPFAFFEGTSPEYKKVAKLTDTIAGYKVTNIQFSSVKLASPTNEIELGVGMQLRREDGGAWQVASAPEPLSAYASTSASSAGKPADGSASAGPPASNTTTNESVTASTSGGSDDVLKRLMQRREQEMNR